MKFKQLLIIMTFVAVVSDYLLHPFFPQFFRLRFGVVEPEAVGNYFAALCAIVMISFPFWAWVSKRKNELSILIYTQFIAGIGAILCYWTDEYAMFWFISLTMVFFKGSYLLVYPYILKVSPLEEHTKTIGILSVLVHLGGILGAVIGGVAVDWIDARYVYLIMAGGDFVQMGICQYLLRKKFTQDRQPIMNEQDSTAQKTSLLFIFKLGLVSLLLYFSDFTIRPFFSSFWEMIAQNDSKILSGTIYAIPGFVALLTLWLAHRMSFKLHLSIIFLTGLIGIALQAVPNEAFIIVGRIIYGWSIFKSTVHLDVVLFSSSNTDNYAVDYSKIHFFQNIGVLLASFSVGNVVASYGLTYPFYIALISGGIAMLGYFYFFQFSPKVKKGNLNLKTS